MKAIAEKVIATFGPTKTRKILSGFYWSRNAIKCLALIPAGYAVLDFGHAAIYGTVPVKGFAVVLGMVVATFVGLHVYRDVGSALQQSPAATVASPQRSYQGQAPIVCSRADLIYVLGCCINKNGCAGVEDFASSTRDGKLVYSATMFAADIEFTDLQEEPTQISCDVAIAPEIVHRFPVLAGVTDGAARLIFQYEAAPTFSAETVGHELNAASDLDAEPA